MRSGNNIHVQQHKTNIINEEWYKTQNDDPFVAFCNMCAVMFVLPDVSIVGLQWLILIPRLNHTGSLISVLKTHLILYQMTKFQPCLNQNHLPLPNEMLLKT